MTKREIDGIVFFPEPIKQSDDVITKDRKLQQEMVVHRKQGKFWYTPFPGATFNHLEFWMQLNRKPLDFEPDRENEFDSRMQTETRTDPLIFTEIDFNSTTLETPLAVCEYPFCDAKIHWGKDGGWRVVTSDGKNDAHLEWTGLSNYELELRLPILYFFHPAKHDEEWVKERIIWIHQHADGSKLSWQDSVRVRGVGWYKALISRAKYNYEKDYISDPVFWTLAMLAWYFRYKTDFMEQDDEMFEWEAILIWEEHYRTEPPRWEGDNYGRI